MPKDHEWPEGEKPLCAGKLQDGIKGCGRPNSCAFNHAYPNAWSPALMKFMKAHVDKHECLKWNYNDVTPEMLGMQYSKS